MQTSVVRFLIVECDPVVRIQLEELIRGSGLGESTSVGTIREALEALDQEIFHVIISAWHLSGLASGLAFLKLIRGEDRFKPMRFVLLSEPSGDEPSKVRAARAAQVDGYLLKPIEEPVLAGLLKEITVEFML